VVVILSQIPQQVQRKAKATLILLLPSVAAKYENKEEKKDNHVGMINHTGDGQLGLLLEKIFCWSVSDTKC
jgi:hypothetical protein